MGWDQGDCWFAHCVKLDEQEMKLFAERGIGIAHCPYSNLRLASGICPVKTLRERGVNVGLGVDGSASNDAGHMLAEARLCMLLQRAEGGRPQPALGCCPPPAARRLPPAARCLHLSARAGSP
jgi:cytosine/adenosine deaminase-related metal-dependent hydrolase